MKIAVINFIEYPNAGDHHWSDVMVETFRDIGHHTIEFKHKRYRHRGANVGVRQVNLNDISSGYLAGRLTEYDVVLFSNLFSGNTSDLSWTNAQRDLISELRHKDVITIGCLHNQIKMYQIDGQIAIFDMIKNLDQLIVSDLTLLDGINTSNTYVMPYLPYRRRMEQHAQLRNAFDGFNHGIMMTGRISTTKGQRFLALMADKLQHNVIVAGRDQMGSARSMREALEKRGFVKRYLTEPTTTWSCVWSAELVNGITFYYAGGYSDVTKLPWLNANVHVNLTENTISRGHLEYTSIEALDAGCRVIAPWHAQSDAAPTAYKAVDYVHYENRKEANPEYIANMINACASERAVLEYTEHDVALHDANEHVSDLLKNF